MIDGLPAVLTEVAFLPSFYEMLLKLINEEIAAQNFISAMERSIAEYNRER